VVEQLRALRAQIGEVTPLTAAQRKALRGRTKTSNPILQASINVIGALENVPLRSASRPPRSARCTTMPTAGRPPRMSCGRC
jgi:hypothetical protein